MTKYECQECGAIKEVEVVAVPPTCEDCGVVMEPVVAGVEEGTEELVADEIEEEEDEDLM